LSQRIAGYLGVAILLAVFLPEAVAAQKSARIRVAARVVESAVPETVAATRQELLQISELGVGEEKLATQPTGTERGIAHVYTEHLAQEPRRPSSDQTFGPAADVDGDRTLVRVTVAYTAN